MTPPLCMYMSDPFLTLLCGLLNSIQVKFPETRKIKFPRIYADCENPRLSPFDQGTTVKNLLYPYDSVTLTASTQKLGMEMGKNWYSYANNTSQD